MNKRATRLIAIAAIAAALPLTVLGATAAPALAAGPSDSTPAPVVNLITDQCLTALDSGIVRTSPCEASGGLQPLQQWTFTDWGAISNPATSGCLAAGGGGIVSVQQCGGPGQLWVPAPGNPQMIMNRVTRQCLTTDSGGAVFTALCLINPFQIWLGANWPS
jgi:Ricin-type beta-trefoil lectin domain